MNESKASLRESWLLSPVMMVPMTRKTQRKMFPASVPNRSMIFPWAMVKMMPNTCSRRRGLAQESEGWMQGKKEEKKKARLPSPL